MINVLFSLRKKHPDGGKVLYNYETFLSPPVHIAWWAHMQRFLSVRPSLDNNSYLRK